MYRIFRAENRATATERLLAIS
jgi:putative restriction endonuclease